MNFLSHYYFDRHIHDPQRVVGMVLPDLVKNTRKDWCIRPEKREGKFQDNELLKNIFIGWKRHLEVDKHFHSSDFFYHHTETIRIKVAPILESSPVRPSFMAHISLELMLDALLLTESVIQAESFYTQISEADRRALHEFLQLNEIAETDLFFKFFDEFIEASYLNSYREANNIMYALGRICQRLWLEPFNETQQLQLTAVLIDYQQDLKNDFMTIFDEIDSLVNR